MKRYLSGIDGLRAIAVLSVLAFHAFPNWVTGGYIGVDMFFVISGFIITRTYLDDLLARRVSLKEFYLKRVRRLAPAYVVVLAATVAAAYFILEPPLLTSFARSLAAQPVYLQNFVFWSQGDYFDVPLTKPLLHTWSLAVEEQFYLLYGLMIVIGWRFPRLVWPLIAIAGCASYLLGSILGPVSPKTTFYLLPTRIWELALGALASRAVFFRGVMARIAGLALVVASIAFFDEGNLFPGMQSLMACTGTVLALWSVENVESSSPTLQNPAMVRIGQLSYSLYLWHWPIIALASTQLQRHLGAVEAALALGIAWVLSELTDRYCEKPIRNRTRLVRPFALVGATALSGVATIVVASLLIASFGGAGRFGPEIAKLYRAEQARSPYRCSIISRIKSYPVEFCRVNEVAGSGGVLIIGDSHADQLDEAIAALGQDVDVPVYLAVRNCKLEAYGGAGFCGEQVLEAIVDNAREASIDVIFATSYMGDKWNPGKFAENAKRFLDAGVGSLYVMEDVPTGDYFSPAMHVNAMRTGRPLPRAMSLADYKQWQEPIDVALKRMANDDPRIRVLDPGELICPDECMFEAKGKPLYFDGHHLSPSGVALIRPLLGEVFEDFKSSDAASD